MSGFICPETGKEYDIFGKGTTDKLAQKFDTFILGELPIDPSIREGGDNGKPITYSKPDSEIAKRYLKSAEILWGEIEKINEQEIVSNEAIQPTTGVSACSTSAGGGSSCGCS